MIFIILMTQKNTQPLILTQLNECLSTIGPTPNDQVVLQL